jgi:hypothetical protein
MGGYGVPGSASTSSAALSACKQETRGAQTPFKLHASNREAMSYWCLTAIRASPQPGPSQIKGTPLLLELWGLLGTASMFGSLLHCLRVLRRTLYVAITVRTSRSMSTCMCSCSEPIQCGPSALEL